MHIFNPSFWTHNGSKRNHNRDQKLQARRAVSARFRSRCVEPDLHQRVALSEDASPAGYRHMVMHKFLWSLGLLNVGCLLRVSSEIPAYEGYRRPAWHVLPISAMTELAAVTLFAVNLLIS